MKQKMVLFFVILLFFQISSLARSIHRPHNLSMPQITFYWKDNPTEKYVLRKPHLEEFPYFKTFDKTMFEKYQLPSTLSIASQRKTTQPITADQIKKLIDEIIPEIIQNKRSYTHFDIIKSEDFNFKDHCGVLVLKFKDYPLILKLFFESPKSLVEPLNKGLIPSFHFYMGGGSNRHLTGFTRIRNRELVAEKIQKFPQWKDTIKLPLKWFYIPAGSRWICLEGINIADKNLLYTEMPGTYAIIAEEIIPERVFSLSNKKDKEIALQLTDDLETTIDANISNFRIEQKTGKIALVDTEHFPSMVGMKKPRRFNSYLDYYFYLSNKFIIDTMFQTKKDRRLGQTAHNHFHANY